MRRCSWGQKRSCSTGGLEAKLDIKYEENDDRELPLRVGAVTLIRLFLPSSGFTDSISNDPREKTIAWKMALENNGH